MMMSSSLPTDHQLCVVLLLVLIQLTTGRTGYCKMNGISSVESRPVSDCDFNDQEETTSGQKMYRTSGALSSLELTVCLDHSNFGGKTGDIAWAPLSSRKKTVHVNRMLYLSWSASEASFRNTTSLKIKVTPSTSSRSKPSQCLHVTLSDIRSDSTPSVHHNIRSLPRTSAAQNEPVISVPIQLNPSETAYRVEITSSDDSSLYIVYWIKVNTAHQQNAWMSPAIAVTSYRGRGLFSITAPSAALVKPVSYSAHLIHCVDDPSDSSDSNGFMPWHRSSDSDHWVDHNCTYTQDETPLMFNKHSKKPVEVPLKEGYYQLWVDATVSEASHAKLTMKTPTFFVAGPELWPTTENANSSKPHAGMLEGSTYSQGKELDVSVLVIIGVVVALCLITALGILICVRRKLCTRQTISSATTKANHIEKAVEQHLSELHIFCSHNLGDSGTGTRGNDAQTNNVEERKLTPVTRIDNTRATRHDNQVPNGVHGCPKVHGDSDKDSVSARGGTLAHGDSTENIILVPPLEDDVDDDKILFQHRNSTVRPHSKDLELRYWNPPIATAYFRNDPRDPQYRRSQSRSLDRSHLSDYGENMLCPECVTLLSGSTCNFDDLSFVRTRLDDLEPPDLKSIATAQLQAGLEDINMKYEKRLITDEAAPTNLDRYSEIASSLGGISV